MMKKGVLIVALIIFTFGSLQAKSFSLGVGLSGQNKIAMGDESKELSFEDFVFGGELRLRLFFLEGSYNTLYDANNENFASLVTAGFNFSLFDIIHLGLGVGPAFAMKINNESYFWASVDKNGSYQGEASFSDAFLNGIMHYRAHVDLKLGKVSAGFNWSVPSKGFYLNADDLAEFLPNWGKVKLGFSVLFYLL
jgi:hypothetical protein